MSWNEPTSKANIRSRPLKEVASISLNETVDITIYKNSTGFIADTYFHDRPESLDFETRTFESKRKLKHFLCGMLLTQVNSMLGKID